MITGLLASPPMSLAQDNEGEPGDSPRRRVARERILRAFDEDGDGRLNEQEIDAVRAQLGERFSGLREQIRELRDRPEPGERQARRREAAEQRSAEPAEARERDRATRRDADRDRRGDRDRDADSGRRRDAARNPAEEARRSGAQRRDLDQRRVERRIQLERRPLAGQRGPDGPPGPIGPMGQLPERNLAPLFGWFDVDGDNLLSRREFAELSQFVERRRPGRPDGPRDGPRFSGRGRIDAFPRPGSGFRDFSDRSRRFEGPPRGDRPDRSDRDARPTDRERPPQPPRPDDPPEPPSQREAGASDAI
jgi:hypothetical protein